jgi:hypothetical protein
LHAFYAADPGEVCVLEGLGLLEVFGLGIHHPDVGVGDIGDLAAGAFENSGEDR